MDEKKYRVQGFKAAAVVAGLKKGDLLDIALIVSDREAAAAGIFTTNKVRAAPVILSERHVENGKARAIIANAGNANACTGDSGLNDARRTAELVGRGLGIRPEDVLVASTGVIGKQLDMHLIEGAIPGLTKALAPDAVPLAARAIMTTDSFPKISSFEGRAGGHSYRIMGIAKGAGMIGPNMGPPQATMLCFIITDAAVEQQWWQGALTQTTDMSFNRIVIDGDTSTNDTVYALANGLAGNQPVNSTHAWASVLKSALLDIMKDLALQIVRDGEGATKCVEIVVKGARDNNDADSVARTVAESPLVKTALFGQDPNWGRIFAAAGRAGAPFNPENVNLWIGDVQIAARGTGTGGNSEEEAARLMTGPEFSITLDLGAGEGTAAIYTCDFSDEYVHINADYRT